MEGTPEGTGYAGRRMPRLRMIVIILIVAAYLIFRLVQGVMWLASHVHL